MIQSNWRGSEVSAWIGYDPREHAAFAVAARSLSEQFGARGINGLSLAPLKRKGMYTRPTRFDEKGRLFDEISEHPMSTEFAISRFFVPILARNPNLQGTSLPLGDSPKDALNLALFMDCDMLVRDRVYPLFEQAVADPSKAVWVVKHNYRPPEGLKMDGQKQTQYNRKNWSSMMVWNCSHPSNLKLTQQLINSVPGRDLHAFCWLEDDEIGELDPRYNWLVGHSDDSIDPAIVHFTEGIPTMPGYENSKFADEWFDVLDRTVLSPYGNI